LVSGTTAQDEVARSYAVDVRSSCLSLHRFLCRWPDPVGKHHQRRWEDPAISLAGNNPQPGVPTIGDDGDGGGLLLRRNRRVFRGPTEGD
ncbi:unnamed protein product, partial [Ectocarpus sp. 12 AP-2014]